MVDIHTHILFGIDDGCETIEDSLNQIKEGINLGFKTFILTPHYIENTSYISNVKENEKRFNKLKNEIKKEQLDVEIYLGNEVMYTDNLTELLKQKEIRTISNTNYLVLEIPRLSIINNFKNTINNLIYDGITPIIVHPERCYYFTSNINIIKELIELGAIIQVNTGSVIGKHGKTAQKTAKYLLKNNMVHLLSTDAHKHYNAVELNKALKYIKRIGGNHLWSLLFVENPQKIIANQKLVLPNRKVLKHEK